LIEAKFAAKRFAFYRICKFDIMQFMQINKYRLIFTKKTNINNVQQEIDKKIIAQK
jgi:hypothetical protein